MLPFTKSRSAAIPIGSASAEYSIPIIDRLRLAWFYDIGEVQARALSF